LTRKGVELEFFILLIKIKPPAMDMGEESANSAVAGKRSYPSS